MNAYDKTYTYDVRGNRAKLIVAGGETVTCTYDANNRLISSTDGKSYTYDANGNTLTERTNGTVSATYAYDAENKLISYTAGNVGYTYGYYPSGLRRTKTALNAQTNASTLTNTYIWDDNNLVKDNTDAYRYGLSAISRNNTYYLHDAHGSVVGIANSSGSISKTYAYDAFGVELSPVASDSITPSAIAASISTRSPAIITSARGTTRRGSGGSSAKTPIGMLRIVSMGIIPRTRRPTFLRYGRTETVIFTAAETR